MIGFSLKGTDELSRALQPIVDRIKHPQPVLRLVGILGERACRRNIDSSTSPEGEPYKPLKRRVGKPLRDKGTLYGGITSQVEGRRVLIGAGAASSAYNAYQQFGSAGYDGQKGNPPRPFIGISDADADEMIEAVADFVEGQR